MTYCCWNFLWLNRCHLQSQPWCETPRLGNWDARKGWDLMLNNFPGILKMDLNDPDMQSYSNQFCKNSWTKKQLLANVKRVQVSLVGRIFSSNYWDSLNQPTQPISISSRSRSRPLHFTRVVTWMDFSNENLDGLWDPGGPSLKLTVQFAPGSKPKPKRKGK